MLRIQVIDHLKEWKRHHDDLQVQQDNLRVLTSGGPECGLMEPVWRMFDAYTKAIGCLVGDKYHHMTWYLMECDMGRRPTTVTLTNGTTIRVRDLRDLARVISGYNK